MPRIKKPEVVIRFPLCGFNRPSAHQPTVAQDSDFYGTIHLYMCHNGCLECDRRLCDLQTRKRYEETHSFDERHADAVAQNMDVSQFIASQVL